MNAGVMRDEATRLPFQFSVTPALVRRDFGQYRGGDRLAFFQDRSDPGGPPTPLGVGVGAYLLNRPDDVAHVLQYGASNYEKTRRLTNRRGRRLSGNGILTSTGDGHRRRREQLAPFFRRQRAIRDAERLARRAAEWADGLPESAPIDLSAAMIRIAEDAIVDNTMSTVVGDERQDLLEAARARRRFFEHVYTSPVPYKELVPTSVVREHRRLVSRFEHIVRAEIARRRRDGGRHDDLLDDLLTLVDREEDFGEADVVDELRMIVVTGHETLAEALTWAFWVLAENRRHQDRIAEEARRLDARPTAADLDRLPLARGAVSESLRLYPPTWLYVRRALGPDRLPSGLHCTRGAKFYICPYTLHRDPEIFPDPERFDPDRFASGWRPPRGAYVPFGLGRHTCLGEPYARTALDLAVSTVLRDVELTGVGDGRPEIDAGIILRAHPSPRVTGHRRLGGGS